MKSLVTAFRNHVPDYLERVHNGEDIALTSRGKVIAGLAPPEDWREYAMQQLVALRATSLRSVHHAHLTK